MPPFLSNVIASIRDRHAAARDPVGFVRSLGVQLNGQVHFYGVTRGMFGSEPWLVSLGDNVYVASGVQFITHDGGTVILRTEHPDLEWTAPITVGDDVFIGMRTILMPGVTIANRCIIGAGAIVTRDVPGNSVVVGVPARVVRTVDEYLESMLSKSLRCGHLPAQEKADAIKAFYGVEAT